MIICHLWNRKNVDDCGAPKLTKIHTIWHWKNYVFGKILKIIDGLLYCVKLHVLARQVRNRITETVVTMLEHDCTTTLLLGDLTIDSHISEIARVS